MTEVLELELTVVEPMQRIQAQAAGDGGDSSFNPTPCKWDKGLNAGPKGEHETFERANASSREPDPAERVDNDDLDERARQGPAGRERAQVGGGVHRYTVGRLV